MLEQILGASVFQTSRRLSL